MKSWIGSPVKKPLAGLSRLICCAALAFAIVGSVARADDVEETYLQIYSTIQQADKLAAGGQAEKARAKYLEAQRDLVVLKRDNRDWNPNMVAFRLNYLAEKLNPSEAPPTAKPAQPAPAAGKGAAVTSPKAPELRLLEAGAEPRKTLRLHPQAGESQSVTITVQTSVETKMGEVATPAMKMPAIAMTLRSTVKDVAESGDIRYDLEVTDAEVAADEGVMPQALAAMQTAVKGLKGLAGTCVSTSRGLNKSVELKPASGGGPMANQLIGQMKDSFSRMTMMLPEEEVGIGAKWEIKRNIRAQGMALAETSTAELTSIEGNVIQVKSTSTQSAKPQKIENPAMPGMKVDLEKFSGTGDSQVKLNLGQLMVAEGTVNEQTDMTMSLDLAGQKQQMSLKNDMRITIKSQ